MTKEEILKELFLLPSEDILDILEIINGYKERLNKSGKDTLLMRMVFVSGLHSIKEYYLKYNLTKDKSLANALNYETTNINDYLKLKQMLYITDLLFLKILFELERIKSGNYE